MKLAVGVGIAVVVIIGLVNFDLFVSIWARLFVSTLLISTIDLLVRSVFASKQIFEEVVNGNLS